MSDERDPHDASPDDEAMDRDAILARRARFVATALVGLTVLPACDSTPRACLNIAPVQTTSATAEPPASASVAPTPDAGAPQPCLEIMPPPPPSAAASASSSAEPDAGPPPKPQPCLSVVRPPQPPPTPCLSAPNRKPDAK